MTPLRQRMIEDMQVRNLSPHTQRPYLRYISQFACHFRKSPGRRCSGYVRSTTNRQEYDPTGSADWHRDRACSLSRQHNGRDLRPP